MSHWVADLSGFVVDVLIVTSVASVLLFICEDEYREVVCDSFLLTWDQFLADLKRACRVYE